MKKAESLRHVRPVRPLAFPSSHPEWEMSQGTRHDRLCALLYALLREACGSDHTAGADQFIYFDASDPRRCCAPDGYVKLGVPEPEDIARDPEGASLLPTAAERDAQAKAAARDAQSQAAVRIAELEAELARLRRT